MVWCQVAGIWHLGTVAGMKKRKLVVSVEGEDHLFDTKEITQFELAREPSMQNLEQDLSEHGAHAEPPRGAAPLPAAAPPEGGADLHVGGRRAHLAQPVRLHPRALPAIEVPRAAQGPVGGRSLLAADARRRRRPRRRRPTAARAAARDRRRGGGGDQGGAAPRLLVAKRAYASLVERWLASRDAEARGGGGGGRPRRPEHPHLGRVRRGQDGGVEARDRVPHRRSRSLRSSSARRRRRSAPTAAPA